MIMGGTSPRPRSVQELLGKNLLAQLDRLDVSSRRVFAGKMQGERRSKRRGRSVEFDDYRLYAPGDDLRHIDWNVYARLDRFFIKVFQEEEDLELDIVLDASASMDAGTPEKSVTAHRLALALAYIGLVHNNRVSLSTFGGAGPDPAVSVLPALRGRQNVPRAAAFVLASLNPGAAPVPGVRRTPAPGFGDAMRVLATTRRGRGVLVLLSDFLFEEGYERGLTYLAGGTDGAGAGFDTCCVQILSPGELDPAKEADAGLAGDLRLTDAETGRTAEVTLSGPVLEAYRARVRAFGDGLRNYAAARRMAYLRLSSDADLETLVLDELRARGVLR